VSQRRRTILVLYWHPEPSQLRAAIRQHLRALEASKNRHTVVYANAYSPLPRWIRPAGFDAIILHTTFLCLRWSHLFPAWKWSLRWIADSRAIKIAMPQDEYDHADVLDEWMREWRVDTVLSNFDEELRSTLYPLSGGTATFRKALTGYIDVATAERLDPNLIPTSRRELDLVYRATHLPFWFGSHGQLKHRVADVVGHRAIKVGLRTDISTRPNDTIVGDRWFDFLASSKAVLGSESGSSVVDHRGEVRAQIQYLLREDPDLDFESVARRMPPGWDDHPYFAISPRHLESVITRTAQVLVEGRYDGILEPGRHYIALKRDLSNRDEVLTLVGDPAYLERMAVRAHHEIYEWGRVTYKDLAEQLDEVLATSHRRMVPFTGAMAWYGQRELVRERTEPSSDVIGWVLRHPRRARVAFRLIWTQAPLRQLLLGYLRSTRARRLARPIALVEELMVLALARLAQAGRATAGEHFRVEVRSDLDGEVLELVSIDPDGFRAEADLESLCAALVRNPVIRFDHSRFGGSMHYALTSRKWVTVTLPGGAGDLRGLSRLSELFPEMMIEALAPLAGREPDHPAASLLSQAELSGMLWRWRSDPLQFAAKGLFGARAILTRPMMRALYGAYLQNRKMRQQIPHQVVFEDLVKLALTELVSVRTTYRDRDRTLIFETTPGQPNRSDALRPRGPIERVVWDNSASGDYMLAPIAAGKRLTFYLGTGGVYEFKSLPALYSSMPDQVLALFRSLRRKG
jgi:hypothetical protein